LDKQQNVRKLKDEIQIAKNSTEEQQKAIRKIQKEIDALALIIEEQEKALANDGSRDNARTEIVAPCRAIPPPLVRGRGGGGDNSNRQYMRSDDELAVRALPRDIVNMDKSKRTK
jgi:hypothetical protein